ncbi:hypothetical protein D9758_009636 [Tetrapyrgos nigripes]|uniref:Glucose-methanol-choline oxidoreductase N-terminal domain-containing protein n=1 Tax=Tetrapyrgos nigripes TaxID=182062 RepID=A0A8H5GD10_9AGAR|nr:hypothetical protein D9758_009636 [Tetrapyrgos nigripes]
MGSILVRVYLALSALTLVRCTGLKESYDYIVVGGGTAGLTVASRLTEDPSINVVVLEAGANAENVQEVFIPGLVGQAPSSLNWAYSTVPQVNLNNRTLTVNAGKALGGSTVINGMIFPRAGRQQYDVWGKLNNDSSWTWDALLPYFKSYERFTPPNQFQMSNGASFEAEVHGFDGRVKVGFPNAFLNQFKLWREASEELELVASPDLDNGDIAPNAVGVTPVSIDPLNNTRCSAACAFYTPFIDRPNFEVLTNATVTRIIWSSTRYPNSDLVASGVEYIANNQTFTVNASREVIVSSGTIGTPRIFELSGVGNSTILAKAGLESVLELPTIGENLADHAHSWVNAFAQNMWDQGSFDPDFKQEQLELWYTNRTGPSSLGLVAPSNLLDTTQLQDLLQQSEENLTLYATLFSNGNAGLAESIRLQHEQLIQLYRDDTSLPLEMNIIPGYQGPLSATDRPTRNFTTISSVLYAPFSRGRTHIASADPTDASLVDPAYWSHPFDIATMVGGIKLARKMSTSEQFRPFYAGEFAPGDKIQGDEALKEWLKGTVASDNHEVGTMSMLPRQLGGVVDTELKVYGISNVRVIDASIIPFPVSAHMSSTVYMVGEKGADIVVKARQSVGNEVV